MTRHIAPAETRPARLDPLAKLPVFLDLKDRRAVVAGGGEPVAWKAELLAAAGAKVTVFAPEASPELLALAAANGTAVGVAARPWQPADLDGAAVAVAELDGDEAARFAAEARGRGALVNVIDRPAFCDFQFGAIVNRSPVVVSISTDGAAPILAQAVRRRIEAILPHSLAGWSETAKSFRDRLARILPSKAARRAFWERFVDVAFITQAEEDERLAELDRLAKEILDGSPKRAGEVVLVGAGPGDPELLTLKAVRELQAADVILYDRLVPKETLELGRREARRILVGKKGHGESCRQEDITRLMVELASSGQRVVRLKGGDPAVFGRAGEEIEACREAGIPVRMVPGITAALAAASALTLSLTHRGVAQRVQFVTGHDRSGDLPVDLDLDALADPRATTCLYMGRQTAGILARRLVANGLRAGTPAAIVGNVSRQGEESIHATLGDLADETVRFPEDGPTLVLIGDALESDRAPEAAPGPRAATPPFIDTRHLAW